MGLKDNFSQAVKELWKKDGQEGEKPQGDREPSELDKYLREQGGGEQPAPAQRPVQGGEVTSNGVPLETPYYPNKEPAQNNVNTQGGAPDSQDVRSADTQPENMPQDGQSVNRNAMNAMSNPNAANTANMANMPNTSNMENSANSANMANFRDNQPNDGAYNQNIRNISQNFGQNARNDGYNQGGYNQGGYNQGNYNRNMGNGDMGNMGNGGMNGRFVPPSGNSGAPAPMGSESEETTIISKNTQIEGNIHSLANMTVDGNIKGNLETTRNVDMTGKIIGDIIANNAAMNSAAMQGNISLKGRMKMDRDTILIGDLSSQYADINGRIRGKLDIVGKAELKRDAIVFGDINASTIAVTDGAIIQGYVNTTFLSKDDSRNVFPDAISIEEQKSGKSNSAPNQGMGSADTNPTS